MKREVEIERFRAKAKDGREYTIVVLQQFISAAHLTDPQAEIPGLKRLITSTGLVVTPDDDPESFKILQTDQIVWKI